MTACVHFSRLAIYYSWELACKHWKALFSVLVLWCFLFNFYFFKGKFISRHVVAQVCITALILTLFSEVVEAKSQCTGNLILLQMQVGKGFPGKRVRAALGVQPFLFHELSAVMEGCNNIFAASRFTQIHPEQTFPVIFYLLCYIQTQMSPRTIK